MREKIIGRMVKHSDEENRRMKAEKAAQKKRAQLLQAWAPPPRGKS